MTFGQDQALTQLVMEVLHETGIKVSDLDKLAVAVGPGSFTAVRIGVAFARGLALTAGVASVGVNLLEVLGRQAQKQCSGLGVGIKSVGRGNWAWCAIGSEHIEQEPVSASLEQVLSQARALAKGRALQFCGDKITDNGDDTDMQCDMGVLADIAMAATAQTHRASPWYSRPPDAKLPGGIDPWRS